MMKRIIVDQAMMEPTITRIPGTFPIASFRLRPNGCVDFDDKLLELNREFRSNDTLFRFSAEEPSLSVRPTSSDSPFPAVDFFYADGIWNCSGPRDDEPPLLESAIQFEPTPWLYSCVAQFGLIPYSNAVCIDKERTDGTSASQYHDLGPIRLVPDGSVIVGPHSYPPSTPFEELVYDHVLIRRTPNRSWFQHAKHLLQIVDLNSGVNHIYCHVGGFWHQLVVECYVPFPNTRARSWELFWRGCSYLRRFAIFTLETAVKNKPHSNQHT